MKEVRRYSDQTVKLAARHVRRATQHLSHVTDLGTRARLVLLVEQLMRLGLQPSDVARPSGADALLAIASTLDLAARYYDYIDTKTLKPPRRTLVIDSCVQSKTTGRAFASLNFNALEQRIAMQMAKQSRAVKLSPTWQRVVDRALRMPGGLP